MNASDLEKAKAAAVDRWRRCRYGIGSWRPDPRAVLTEAANELVYQGAADARAGRHSEALILLVAADMLHDCRHRIDSRAGDVIRNRLQVRSSP